MVGHKCNISDAGQPVSTTQLAALNLKANLASPTFTGTVNWNNKSNGWFNNVDNIK
jgi:hypothetical protein